MKNPVRDTSERRSAKCDVCTESVDVPNNDFGLAVLAKFTEIHLGSCSEKDA